MPVFAAQAVYNSPIPKMYRLRLASWRALGFLIIFSTLFAAYAAAADDWSAPEAELARKIAGLTGQSQVALTIANRSSLNDSERDQIGRGLRAAIAGAGVKLVDGEPAGVTVQVSLSENLRSYIWTAEVKQVGKEDSIVMVSFARSSRDPVPVQPPKVYLRKTLLWSQAEQILDVAAREDAPAPSMLVLDANAITAYQLKEGRWRPDHALPVTHTRAWPRDLRGRIVRQGGGSFDAYLPGVVCHATENTATIMDCHASDDPWPIGPEQFGLRAMIDPTRDFFTGLVAPAGPQASVRPFYSAAPLPQNKNTLWLLAATDGTIHKLDGNTDQSLNATDFGSDVAAVRSECGTEWQLLATRRGRTNDALSAYEMPDREPVRVSLPLEFAGTITALWTEPKGNGVIAVVKNAASGQYEAYRVTIACQL